ncbi:MAG: elongation factor Ts [Erysipelotrichia bacterium]|jgi:elongation factor Ts|nr:elongation factor Ts [Erysipelotrichia bacterium]
MISASLVKELRERTGAGMMDCKKALEATEGNIDSAIDWLREKGISKAAKKADRIAAEGLTNIAVDGNQAVLVELNSETDFVASNAQFLELLNKVTKALLVSDVVSVEDALHIQVDGVSLQEILLNATATIGEKITLRRFARVAKTDADFFGHYVHKTDAKITVGGRTSALVVLHGGSQEVAKDMAMQVASMSPTYISRDHMPQDVVSKERDIQREIAMNDDALKSKPENVLNGIVEGRLSKSLQDMCLVDQLFFKDQDKKIAQVLKETNATVVSFVRYGVGEGIEKKEDNFVEEVMNQAFGK